MKYSLLFVCLGNICRSPLAEGAMLHLVQEAGLDRVIAVDSAGTAGYHVGHLPDPRSLKVARQRGLVLPSRARQLQTDDFARFDYLLAMDLENLAEIQRKAPSGTAAKICLLRDFDAQSPQGSQVPDPYYGQERDFAEVLDLCTAACRGLLEHLRKKLAPE